jgi:hypothetical protein
MSLNTSFSVVMGYGLDGWGLIFLAVQDLSLFHSIQTTSGPTQSPIQCVPGPLLLVAKQQGCEADHLPSSGSEVRNGRAVLPFLHMSSWHGA